MPSIEELSGLVDRVKAATRADGSIDADLAIAMGAQYRSRKGRGREWLEDSHGGVETWVRRPPAYTASLDAITALIERQLPKQTPELIRQALSDLGKRFGWHITFPKPGQMAMLPLALCAAFLTALISMQAQS